MGDKVSNRLLYLEYMLAADSNKMMNPFDDGGQNKQMFNCSNKLDDSVRPLPVVGGGALNKNHHPVLEKKINNPDGWPNKRETQHSSFKKKKPIRIIRKIKPTYKYVNICGLIQNSRMA